MGQQAISFLLMRAGTSRGPFFLRDHLPSDPDRLSRVLIAAVGSGHALNIDGIGGGNAVTTKVAMLSKSEDEWADVDYFFAQVSVADQKVDFKPTCGNMLSGVGPAAIEMGLHPVAGDMTEIKIRAVNTGARVIAKVKTPNGQVCYDGDTRIDGVPGEAAAIELSFMDVAGSSTGAILPTGAARDTIDGIDVTCMDVAMPMVIARATDFGLTGHETREELDANQALFERMERIRRAAGKKMGMGDVADSVTPKFGLIAPAINGGTVAGRYFMPWTTHPTMAVTGAQCLATCALTEGTVADGLVDRPVGVPATVMLEHPLGKMDVAVDLANAGEIDVRSVGLIRTARKIAAGEIFVPDAAWGWGETEKPEAGANRKMIA